ncbi:MAG: hypothetical protein AAFV32_06905 [Myxococcota bacterium]
MKQILLFTGLFLAAPALAHAGSVDAKIKEVRVDRDGRGLMRFTSNVNNGPSCATLTEALAFDTKQPGGESMLRLATAAYLAGKRVIVNGTGQCDVYSTTETATILRVVE